METDDPHIRKELYMKKGDYMAVVEKVITQIKDGAFLTVKAGKVFNTMTIGWALIGYAWRKPVLMVLVRTSRHTYADTVYGNALNVMQTVKEFQATGVAGIHLADQITAKKHGHYEEKSLIPEGEMMKEIDAAIVARSDPNFVIVLRTDVRSLNGLEDKGTAGSDE